VIIPAEFDIPKDEIFDAAEKIVTIQRKHFNDDSQKFYNVVVLPRAENVAGVRFENMFITFLKKDVTLLQIYLLFAHEMSHNWLDAKIIEPEENESSLQYVWFYEGVNEYFARKVLLESGLIEEDLFITLTNRDVVNIADNPHKSATIDDVLEAVKQKKYGQAFNKLSYYRGALMAFNWDTQIRKFDPNLSLGDFVREVYRESTRMGRGIKKKELFDLAQKFGIDAKKDFEKYILRGESIKFDVTEYNGKYVLENTDVAAFDPGFAIRESYENKVVTGVVNDSAAFKAGLRNGMQFVSAKNESRFSNAWSPDEPLTVVVKSDGREKEIKYFPHGKSIKLPQFVKK
ncbi:MAG: hypothetical protein KDB79_03950, partial [Acidobacteria bacterium]|nr:hypothetical protein [Acidobacteriota bacterium]